ncbi:MAG: hypothetical protein F6K39_25440 [Okeania sp. SIO3B3]|nr:hypothetical protein [Okeania sp. SIO3B3]
MAKYIIFQADEDEPFWEDRMLQHTQALTEMLQEVWDYSDKPIPEPGYRPLDFVQVKEDYNPEIHAHSTHYRQSNWEVTRVEVYTPEIPVTKFDQIVICYCRYNPINSELKLMPGRQISKESFDTKEQYEEWLTTKK